MRFEKLFLAVIMAPEIGRCFLTAGNSYEYEAGGRPSPSGSKNSEWRHACSAFGRVLGHRYEIAMRRNQRCNILKKENSRKETGNAKDRRSRKENDERGK